ncbi:MAG: ATP-binding protein [Candidatus Eisenbacteria bacterium]|jgi:signal transduction histidine kinase|nr:ATP-binding protein [Candidatus Eisenbacteria bacterium]
MKELALHIQDIAENSVRAGAALIEIQVTEDARADRLTVSIVDNGCGMDQETAARALDPFFSTKDVRKVGMGLSLFQQAARRAGGDMVLHTEKGAGTRVVAYFQRSHIDRQPLGDMAATITAILLQNPAVEVVFCHATDDDEFRFDTRELRTILDDVPLSDPEVLRFISGLIRERRHLT